MADNVENLMLEHLKRFQASLDRVENKISDLNIRAANLESGQAAIMQHLTHFSGANAAQQVSIDRLNERLDRIERRLNLTN